MNGGERIYGAGWHLRHVHVYGEVPVPDLSNSVDSSG